MRKVDYTIDSNGKFITLQRKHLQSLRKNKLKIDPEHLKDSHQSTHVELKDR